MSSVDDRIVNMQFNSKQFTSGASESQKALLGVESTMSKVAKSKGLDNLGASVEQTAKKFSIMQIAGVSAVATIASKATSMGLNFLKSFTLGPVMEGFQEYQTNLNSIQTIMANTGKGVGTVNKYLDKLNTYADMTIYNFGEMARNIGTFTAAGVRLKPAVSAIKGIANLAAMSGSSSQQASTAMYQLSQAIAAGRVNLQDWNSVVNAGMGGKNFQKALAQTAVAMGKVSAGAVKIGDKVTIAGKSFRESISGQGSWLNSDILVRTLENLDGRLSLTAIKAEIASKKFGKAGWDEARMQEKATKLYQKNIEELRKQGYSEEQIKDMQKMADAAYDSATQVKSLPQLIGSVKERLGSLWSNVFRTVMGDFEQSKKMWTTASDAIGKVIDGLSKSISVILAAWTAVYGTDKDGDEISGRIDMIKGFRRSVRHLAKVLGAIKGAFTDVFPPNGGQILNSISYNFKRLLHYLKPSPETIEKLRSGFGGFFAILHTGIYIVTSIMKGVKAFFGALFQGSSEGRSGILTLFAALGETLKAFDRFITRGGEFEAVMTGIGAAAGALIKPILKIVGVLIQAFGALFSGKGLDEFKSSLGALKEPFAQIVSTVTGALAKLTAPFDKISSFFEGLKSQADAVVKSFDSVGGVMDRFSGGADKAKNSVAETGKGLVNQTKNLLGLKTASDETTKSVQILGKKMDVTKASGQVSNAVKGFSGKAMDSGLVSKAKATITGKPMQTSGASKMGGLGAAAGLGSTEMDAASTLDVAKTKSLSAMDVIKGAFGELVNMAAAALPIIGKAFGWVAEQFNALFGNKDALDWAALINALLTGALIKTLLNFSKPLGEFGKGVKEVFGALTDTLSAMQKQLRYTILIGIGIAVGLLVASMFAIATLDPTKVLVGLSAISGLIGILVFAFVALNKIEESEGDLALIGKTMITMSAAVFILALALRKLGELNMEQTLVGVAAITAMMGLLVGAAAALAKMGKSAPAAALAMIHMSIAIGLLTASVLAFGKMDPEVLKQGMMAVGLAIAAMTGSLILLSKFAGSIITSAGSMIAMAIAINLLASAVFAFGSMDSEVLKQGGIAVAAMLTVLTVALIALGLAGPLVMIGGLAAIFLAVALNLLVPAIFAFGNMSDEVLDKAIEHLTKLIPALLKFGAAALLAAPGVLALGVGFALLGAGMLAFGLGFALLTGAGMAGIAILSAAISAFIALLPNIAIQIAAAFVAFIESIAKAAPRVRVAFQKIVEALLGALGDLIDEAVDFAVRFGKTLLQGIRRLLPDLGRTLDDLVQFLADRLVNQVQVLVTAGRELLIGVMEGIGDSAEPIATAAFQMLIDFCDGLTKAINENGDALKTAAKNLLDALFNFLTGGIGPKVKSLLKDLGGKLKDGAKNIPIIGNVLGRQAVKGLKKEEKNVKKAAKEFGKGLEEGLVDGVKSALRAVGNLISQGVAEIMALFQTRASSQSVADTLQKTADIISERAENAKGKKRQKALDKYAKRVQRSADRAQAKADRDAANLQRRRDIEDSKDDDSGLADTYAQQADETAEEARTMIAQAQALDQQIKAMGKAKGKQNKALKKQLQTERDELVAEAGRLADYATSATLAASQAYSRSIQSQLDDLDLLIKKENEVRDWDEKYEKAVGSAKQKMAKDRADRAKADAELAKTSAVAGSEGYETLMQMARNAQAQGQYKLADTLLQQATDRYAEWKAYIDEWKQYSKEAEESMNNAVNGGPGSSILPSAGVLASAAKSVDAYTESMRQGMEAAAAKQPIYQFNQTNNSPKALSPSETYRLGSNLVSRAANSSK